MDVPSATAMLYDDTCTPSSWKLRFQEFVTAFPAFDLDRISTAKLDMLLAVGRETRQPIALTLTGFIRPGVALPEGVVFAGGWAARELLGGARGAGEGCTQPAYSDLDFFITPAASALALEPPAKVGLVFQCGPIVTIAREGSQTLRQYILHDKAGSGRELVSDFDFVHLQVWQQGAVSYATAEAVYAWRTKKTFPSYTRVHHVQPARFAKAVEEGFEIIPCPVDHSKPVYFEALGVPAPSSTLSTHETTAWADGKTAALGRTRAIRLMKEEVIAANMDNEAYAAALAPMSAAITAAYGKQVNVFATQFEAFSAARRDLKSSAGKISPYLY